MQVFEAKRMKALEDENTRPERLLADAMLDDVALKVMLTLVADRGKLSPISMDPHAMSEPRAFKTVGSCRLTKRCKPVRTYDSGLRQRMKACVPPLRLSTRSPSSPSPDHPRWTAVAPIWLDLSYPNPLCWPRSLPRQNSPLSSNPTPLGQMVFDEELIHHPALMINVSYAGPLRDPT